MRTLEENIYFPNYLNKKDKENQNKNKNNFNLKLGLLSLLNQPF